MNFASLFVSTLPHATPRPPPFNPNALCHVVVSWPLCGPFYLNVLQNVHVDFLFNFVFDFHYSYSPPPPPHTLHWHNSLPPPLHPLVAHAHKSSSHSLAHYAIACTNDALRARPRRVWSTSTSTTPSTSTLQPHAATCNCNCN